MSLPYSKFGIPTAWGLINNIIMYIKLLFRSDSEDPVSYPFIDNFCGDPDELNVYESLIIHSNGQSKNGQYSIEAFSFNGNENGEIYLHCTVS